MARIKEEAKTQKDLYGQGSQQETYYAVRTVHYSKANICGASAILNLRSNSNNRPFIF